MQTPLDPQQQILFGPGGPFELVEEEVLGEKMEVIRGRPRSLREVLTNASGFGDAEYIVHDELRLSYREHEARVGSVARALRERFGVDGGVSFVPDCALHVEPERIHLPALRSDRPTIGVCLRLDRAARIAVAALIDYADLGPVMPSALWLEQSPGSGLRGGEPDD